MIQRKQHRFRCSLLAAADLTPRKAEPQGALQKADLADIGPEGSMTQIRIDEALWSAAIAPVGVLRRWLRTNGEQISRGEVLAELMVEGARHELLAPASGRLQLFSEERAVIAPGDIIGQID